MIGVERHDAQRIDRQLLGRAGRQGDPGSGQFFVSPEDDLIQRYSAPLAERMRRTAVGQSNPAFDRSVRGLQRSAERENLRKREEAMREELWLQEIQASLL